MWSRVSSGSLLLSDHMGDCSSQTPALRWGHGQHGWNDRSHLQVEAASVPFSGPSLSFSVGGEHGAMC